MTNREWLKSLSEKDFIEQMFAGMPSDLYRNFGTWKILEWLDKEHTKDDEVNIND